MLVLSHDDVLKDLSIKQDLLGHFIKVRSDMRVPSFITAIHISAVRGRRHERYTNSDGGIRKLPKQRSSFPQITFGEKTGN